MLKNLALLRMLLKHSCIVINKDSIVLALHDHSAHCYNDYHDVVYCVHYEDVYDINISSSYDCDKVYKTYLVI